MKRLNDGAFVTQDTAQAPPVPGENSRLDSPGPPQQQTAILENQPQSPSLNLHQIILGHHELLSHFKAFPFFFPGLDLARVERPRVQVVLLLLLLRTTTTQARRYGGPSKLWETRFQRPSHSVFAFLLHDVLSVLQHLLLPQVKEVGGIRVELQGFPPIIPLDSC